MLGCKFNRIILFRNMWHSIFLVISLAVAVTVCQKQTPPKSSKPELKFVFVSVRGPAHTPCDYPGGPRIIEIPESKSRLSWRGRYDAYDYGKEIDELYRYRLDVERWNKSHYWSLASTSPRTIQGALVLGAGLENKLYKIHRRWSEKSKKSTQFAAMQEYLRFYSKQQCPAYLETVLQQCDDPKLPNLERSIKIFEEKIVDTKINYRAKPQNIWLAYESMFNVFYSYKRRFESKFKYWRKVRKDLKNFSMHLMWSALTGSDKLRKLASGPIVNDVLNDIDYIISGKGQPHAPGGNKNKLSVLTAPQGVLAALVTGFAPNGTTIGEKLFTASDLYPEHGAMHVIELYKLPDERGKQKENQWQVKLLYKNKRRDFLKVLKLPNCGNMCDYSKFKQSFANVKMGGEQHKQMCHKTLN